MTLPQGSQVNRQKKRAPKITLGTRFTFNEPVAQNPKLAVTYHWRPRSYKPS